MKYIIKRTFLQNNNYCCFLSEETIENIYLDDVWTVDINKSITLDCEEAEEWIDGLEEEQEDNIKYKYEIIKVKETISERKVEII